MYMLIFIIFVFTRRSSVRPPPKLIYFCSAAVIISLSLHFSPHIIALITPWPPQQFDLTALIPASLIKVRVPKHSGLQAKKQNHNTVMGFLMELRHHSSNTDSKSTPRTRPG